MMDWIQLRTHLADYIYPHFGCREVWPDDYQMAAPPTTSTLQRAGRSEYLSLSKTLQKKHDARQQKDLNIPF